MEILTTFSSYCSFYTLAKNYLPTPYKSKARVLVSLINSLFLSSLSYYTFQNGTFHPVTHYIVNMPDQAWLSNYVIGYFAADLFLGHLFDRENFNFLSGYIHHSVFMVMTYHIHVTQQSNLIYLLVPFEIPTLFLDLIHLNKDPLLDLTFGSTFIMFRIVYNIYLIHAFAIYYTPYSCALSLLLVLHIHWFRKWLQKQQANFF